MRRLHEFPYKVHVQDNGRQKYTQGSFIWHEGDIQKWASDYFGLENVWDTWALTGQNPSVYYFMKEEDFVIFCLKFGNKNVASP
jgi:hypothetical protein